MDFIAYVNIFWTRADLGALEGSVASVAPILHAEPATASSTRSTVTSFFVSWFRCLCFVLPCMLSSRARTVDGGGGVFYDHLLSHRKKSQEIAKVCDVSQEIALNCDTSHAMMTCRMRRMTCRMRRVTCRTSHATCRTSHATCHTSQATCRNLMRFLATRRKILRFLAM